jgi:hypothetical protein
MAFSWPYVDAVCRCALGHWDPNLEVDVLGRSRGADSPPALGGPKSTSLERRQFATRLRHSEAPNFGSNSCLALGRGFLHSLFVKEAPYCCSPSPKRLR